jgi:hypothetical protein
MSERCSHVLRVPGHSVFIKPMLEFVLVLGHDPGCLSEIMTEDANVALRANA